MATPLKSFRLTVGDLDALDAICSSWGDVSRTAALRKLIYEEVERCSLGAEAAEGFIRRLRETYGDATLEVELNGARVDAATIGGCPLDRAAVEMVFDVGGRAELRLRDVDGLSSLLLAELYPPPNGIEWTHPLPLAALTPQMGAAQ